MKQPKQSTFGFLAGLGSGTSFALASLFTKQIYNEGLGEWPFMAVTGLLSLLFLLPFWRGGDWRATLPAGLAGFFSIALYNIALARLDLVIAVIFAYTFPVFALLTAWVWRGRRPTLWQSFAALLCVLGIVVVSGGGQIFTESAMDPVGVAAAILCAVAHAVYGLVGEKLSNREGAQAVIVTNLFMVMAALALAPVPSLSAFGSPASLWVWLLLAAVVGRVLPLWLYSTGSRMAGVGPVALAATSELPLSLLIGLLLLGESMDFHQGLGALLVALSIAVGQVSPAVQKESHAA